MLEEMPLPLLCLTGSSVNTVLILGLSTSHQRVVTHKHSGLNCPTPRKSLGGDPLPLSLTWRQCVSCRWNSCLLNVNCHFRKYILQLTDLYNTQWNGKEVLKYEYVHILFYIVLFSQKSLHFILQPLQWVHNEMAAAPVPSGIVKLWTILHIALFSSLLDHKHMEQPCKLAFV